MSNCDTGLKDLVPQIEELRDAGQRIVFTNGCFDILHVGHVRYLSMARAEGDVLVVGLNSDASIRKIKAQGRPLIDQAFSDTFGTVPRVHDSRKQATDKKENSKPDIQQQT